MQKSKVKFKIKKFKFYISVLTTIFVLLSGSADAEEFRYEAKGKRDPFIPLVGPDRVAIAGLEDIVSIDDVNLEGIAVGAQGNTVVMINGHMLKEGDKVGSLEVKKITKSVVTLAVGGKAYNLKLTEEGGAKGGK